MVLSLISTAMGTEDGNGRRNDRPGALLSADGIITAVG